MRQNGRWQGKGVLARLRHDTAGNTLAIMAASMVPVLALAGSAIDTARMYVVKVRLQQACDAGVLAGRKFMTSSNNAALDRVATEQATAFFNNNFKSGWMQTSTVQFTPTKTADQQVAGTAVATVPMTLMKIFNAADVRLSVECEARYDVADTDIVFVLDTTGSMACAPEDSSSVCTTYVNDVTTGTYVRPANGVPHQVAGYAGSIGYAVPEKSNSRIGALRTAVKAFQQTMAANVDPSTHIRYGFVTYASSVNAGGALNAVSASHMVSQATYQSRIVTADWTESTRTDDGTGLNESQCNAQLDGVRTPSAANTTSKPPYTYNSATGRAEIVDYDWVSTTSGRTTTWKCRKTTRTVGPRWTYKALSLDTSGLVAGRSVQDPTSVTTSLTSWAGCVEAQMTSATATFNQSALPADLDPKSSLAWAPQWPAVTYGRYLGTRLTQVDGVWKRVNTFTSTNDLLRNDNDTTLTRPYNDPDRFESGNVACGKPIRRLAEMTAAEIAGYVDAVDFKAVGGTYHDLGMIWGTRLLAPGGIFAADSAAWPGRQQPKRVIVFLTDGDMSPSETGLSMYGLEALAKKVTGGELDDMKADHNARFLAECTAAKALNIDVWTVAIGLDSTDELTTCASVSAQALDTTSGSGLSAHFEKIAKQIAMLRVSR